MATRPRKGPAPATPDAIERAYTQAVRGVNARLVAAARAFLWPALERSARLSASNGQDSRLDAADDLSPFADLDFGVLQVRLGRLASGASHRLVDQFGRRLGTWNRADMERILKIDLANEPPEVRAVLDAWRRENVSLITSIASRLHEDVHEVVRDAQRRGAHVDTVRRELLERFDVSRSRATLIARDQILKANSDLTRERHMEAGITRYVWSTSRDERVRPMHRDLEGTIHEWDDPPVTNEQGDRNNPGEDYQCRCVAVPVLDDPNLSLPTLGPRPF